MKRYNNLYEKIYDINNLKLAHYNARKGKIHYKEVQMVDSDVDFYIKDIHFMLKNKTYKISDYKIYTKFDGKKEREIFVLPYYPDRIIQWAIIQIVEDIWIKSLISQTYSSIKNRGIHKCVKKLSYDLYKYKPEYCLKLDIKKFYPSINHDILKNIIRKKIKDKDLLELLDHIIDSANGVPIGNYLSQYFGNLYLNQFDHWIKENKHIKFYYRYCDDIVILHNDKQFLHELLLNINNYLNNNLKLTLKENYQIFPIEKRGIDFVGYRFFGNYILLRKSIKNNMKKKIIPMYDFKDITKHDLNVIGSYNGWIKWCNGYRLYKKYLENLKNKEVI